MRTKINGWLITVLGSLAVAAAGLSGCHGNSSANQVSVTVTDSLGGIVVVTQADTITATVTGPATVGGVANLDVTFSCTYTTTPPSGSTVVAIKATSCSSPPTGVNLGTFSNVQPTTEIYTAPPTIPDPTMFPNLVLTITAVSVADTSKKGTLTLSLDSGITVTISPSAATLALGENKTFVASLTTDTTPNDVTWGVTNSTVNTGGTPSIANTYTLTTPTCTSTDVTTNCGSIDQNGKYTAPSGAALPTNAVVTIYAIAKKDTSRVAIATVTLVLGGPITFNSLWPTVVPQGAALADVFLNATNLTSQIGLSITFTPADPTAPTHTYPIDAGSNAVKTFFTPSTYTATTGPVSTGARLRLAASFLQKPGTYVVTIVPSVTGNDGGGPIATHSFTVIPVRPGLVSSFPSNISEGGTGQQFYADGGYYGTPSGPSVGLNFNGTPVNIVIPPVGSDPRRIVGTTPPIANTAGLFPINVTNENDVTSPATAYSNVAVLPSYANPSVTPSSLPSDINGKTFAPCSTSATGCVADANGNYPFQICVSTCTYPAPISLGANTLPSAIALDPLLGYGAVTEAGTNMVQFINLNTPTPSLVGAFPTGSPAAGNLPTGVAIDRNVCTQGTAAGCTVSQAVVAVVNYEAQTLTIITIPGGKLLETIPMNNLIPQSGVATPNPSPNPYSVGIDPFTHRALVAFASTNAGFVVNLDQTQPASICLPGFAPGDGTSYCPVALATLNTGTNPQIAFEPGAHLMYVTPGGIAGNLTAVNLSNPSQGPLQIASAVRTAGIVTVTMAPNTPHNIPPGTSPTVLISGLPPGAGGTSFNGAFPVLSEPTQLSFTYPQAGPDDSTASTMAMQGFLSEGTNAITYAVNTHLQGIDINPITHSAVLANPNGSGSSTGGPQIAFIDSLDQEVTSLTLCNGINAYVITPAPPCSPEVGVAAVAYQPFTNTVVALRFDLQTLSNNQISLLDPSANDRVTIVQTGQLAAGSISFTPSAPPNSTPITVALSGAVAVDPIHNVAFAVNAGSGNITPLYLGTITPLQIETVSTPPVDTTGGIPNPGITNPASVSQSVLFNSTKPAQPIPGVKIFGRGFSGSTQVRLDGVPLPPSDVTFSAANPNELDVTIPVTNGSQNILTGPRNFGLDVSNGVGSTSNVMDFRVIEAIPIPACTAGNAVPGGVTIVNDLVGTGKNYALVTETACGQLAMISLNNDGTYGSITRTMATGATPIGVAAIPRFGYAVTSNSTAGTASILNLSTGAQVVADVTVGTQPTGVAIEQETGVAVIANTSSNTVTVIDLTPLQASPVGTLAPLTVATDQNPIAVAIDPDAGGNATGLAAVTSLNISASIGLGALDAIDISLAVPAKNFAAGTSISAIPTGIVFDPAAADGEFYATESEFNSIIAFDPLQGTTKTVQVGINPYSIAYNFQTSSILTVNSASNTVSVIDALPLSTSLLVPKTEATVGIGGFSLFSAAIEPFSNVAVIVDQANNRALLFPLPH